MRRGLAEASQARRRGLAEGPKHAEALSNGPKLEELFESAPQAR